MPCCLQYLALKLRLKARSNVLDIGCGIGGPMREISLFSGARVTGGQLQSRTSCMMGLMMLMHF